MAQKSAQGRGHGGGGGAHFVSDFRAIPEYSHTCVTQIFFSVEAYYLRALFPILVISGADINKLIKILPWNRLFDFVPGSLILLQKSMKILVNRDAFRQCVHISCRFIVRIDVRGIFFRNAIVKTTAT